MRTFLFGSLLVIEICIAGYCVLTLEEVKLGERLGRIFAFFAAAIAFYLPALLVEDVPVVGPFILGNLTSVTGWILGLSGAVFVVGLLVCIGDVISNKSEEFKTVWKAGWRIVAIVICCIAGRFSIAMLQR